MLAARSPAGRLLGALALPGWSAAAAPLLQPWELQDRCLDPACHVTDQPSSSAACWPPAPWALQQARHFAKKKGGGGKSAAPPPKTAPKVKVEDPYAPATYKLDTTPRRDPLKDLPDGQRTLLASLVPGNAGADDARLRSLRQVGWPLEARDVLSLMQESASAVFNTNVQFVPFVFSDKFQCASALAGSVAEALESGQAFNRIEQELAQELADETAERTFVGLRVQVKGRLKGKGGKAEKKGWAWGRFGTSDAMAPVDYARAAALTRAGYIGVKVWIVYKPEAFERLDGSRPGAPPPTLADVLSLPRPTPVRLSRSAWWAVPAPLQPVQHRAWECFQPGFDPTAPLAAQLARRAPPRGAPPGFSLTAGSVAGAPASEGQP